MANYVRARVRAYRKCALAKSAQKIQEVDNQQLVKVRSDVRQNVLKSHQRGRNDTIVIGFYSHLRLEVVYI
jgi:hypothetical protein